MTLAQLEALFFEYISQVSTNTELSSGNENVWLDDAYRQIISEHRPTIQTKSLSFTSAYKKDFSDLAITNYDLLGVHSVTWTNPSTNETYPLRELPTEDLLDLYTNTSTPSPTSTDGQYYSYRRTSSDAFHVYPAATSTATTVKVNFYVAPQLTITDPGGPDTTIIPAAYHSLIAKQAAANFLLARADESATAFMQAIVQPARQQFEAWCREQNPEPIQKFSYWY